MTARRWPVGDAGVSPSAGFPGPASNRSGYSGRSTEPVRASGSGWLARGQLLKLRSQRGLAATAIAFSVGDYAFTVQRDHGRLTNDFQVAQRSTHRLRSYDVRVALARGVGIQGGRVLGVCDQVKIDLAGEFGGDFAQRL